MKRLKLLLLFTLSGFAAYPCNSSWNYCSTAESAEPFIDDAMQNCCGGTSVSIVDLCGNENKFVIITSDGPNSSCPPTIG